MEKPDQIYAFVGGKIALLQRGDPWAKGMLARLRRGAGKGPADAPDTWEATLGDIPDSLVASKIGATEAEWAIHVALTLYSLHQQGSDAPVSAKSERGDWKSFASACRRLISPDGGNEDAIKRRFDSIITALDLAELSYHARGLVQLMRASDKPIQVDYPQLAKDLYFYQMSGGRQGVLLRWGSDFYRNRPDEGKKKEQVAS